MALYHFESLHGAAKQIRLLTLIPAAFGSEVCIMLERIELGGANPPDYEALSYVWGSTLAPDSVQILLSKKQGQDGARILNVTKNLSSALQHLRYETRPRVMWIDAICIDQSNLKERSYQVALMSDIYQLAQRVVVWLGPETPNSSTALNMMECLGSNISVDWNLETMTIAPISSEDPSDPHE